MGNENEWACRKNHLLFSIIKSIFFIKSFLVSTTIATSVLLPQHQKKHPHSWQLMLEFWSRSNQAIFRSNPPSTRKAAPFVAEASREAT